MCPEVTLQVPVLSYCAERPSQRGAQGGVISPEVTLQVPVLSYCAEKSPYMVQCKSYCASSSPYKSWARDNFLASRQRQRDNVIEPRGPVRDQTKIEK